MSVEIAAQAEPIAPAATEPWPGPAQAWYAIFIFALALMVDFLDRGIVGLLVRPIEQDLHLNDLQISLVTGFAYVSIYAMVGLPIARWADYGTRRNIVAAGVTVWSLMTAFCGLAQNFWQLFFCRVGVGVGEACNGPPVFSMISDLFPREKLPRAIAVLNFGFIAGTGLAAILGGTVIRALAHVQEVRVPVIGALHPWQMTFIVVGLIGLVVALLMGTVKEPLRRGRISGAAGRGTLSVRAIARFVADNRGTYAPMFIGLGFNVVMAFGFSVWAAEFFRRSFAWAPADFAITSGFITIIVAPVGAIFGSWLAERFYREGRDDANMRVVLLSFMFNAPGLLLLTLAPSAPIAFGIFAYTQFVAMWVPGPMNAALQVVTPNEMRAQVTALFLFVFNIVGFGVGPSVVASITQYAFHDPAMLRYALASVIAVLGPLGIASVWWGLNAYGRSVAKARAWG